MMQLGLYEWVYLITGIFETYIIFIFMKVFFDTRKTSGRTELLSYAVYYSIVSTIYILVNIPVVLMFVNLTAIFIITFNYESALKKRILSVFLMYLVFMSVELAVALVSGYFHFPIFSTNNYSSIYGLIVFRIISYVIVLILKNFKNIKKGESVPNSNWFCIVLIPASSLYVIVLLFQARGLSIYEVLVGVILLMLINFSTFYLYDVITAAVSEKMKNLLVLEQNKYYNTQLELMKASLHTLKEVKHDLKNHMHSIRSLVVNGDQQETLGYISGIMEDFVTRRDFASSGNTVIDSIINFKFQEAEQRGIKTMLDLKIPEKLDITSLDMTIILGNLLDNSINAANKVIENRYIKLKIKFDKGRLIIEADNPYSGEIKEENGRILTTNKDKENHGIGLESIKKVIQKYDGIINIDHSDNIFSVSLLMYVD